MRIHRWSICFFVVVAIVAGVSGCGSSSDVKSIMKSINDSNGKRLANFYAMYQTRSRTLTGPVDQQALEKFIVSVNPAELDAMGVAVDEVGQLFVSERDGKPFVVRYGVKKPPVLGGHQAVICEAEGKGGTVAVFMTGPKVVEVSASEIESYMRGDRDEAPPKPGGPPPQR
jgi:ABC-type dipeptide/oligopeptide/nickel transport system ATPase component